jgi:hypothetical protein
LPLGAVEVLQDLLAALQIELTALGKAQRSRGAQKQGQTELILELRDGAGDDRGRKLKRRAASVKLPSLATATNMRMALRRSIPLLLK